MHEEIEVWIDSLQQDTFPVESWDSGYQSFEPSTMLSIASISSPVSSSVSRSLPPKTTPAQVLLNLSQCDPPIYTETQQVLPPAVKALRHYLINDIDKAVIPSELTGLIKETAPLEFLETPIGAYCNNSAYADQDLLELQKIVLQVYREAAKCWDRMKDETTWCELIVSQVLRYSVKSNYPAAIMNVQSQGINSKVLPVPPKGIRLPKRVDYAFSLDDDDEVVSQVLQEFKGKCPHTKAGILTTPCSANTPLFSGVEVKARSADEAEAFIQLCIFLSSVLNKYRQISGRDPPPVPGLIAKGHDWRVYLSWMENGRVFVNGPLRLQGMEPNTQNLHGIFILLELCHRISAYGKKTYWPWIKSTLESH